MLYPRSLCSLTFLSLTESAWFGTLKWSAKFNFLLGGLKKNVLKETKFSVLFNNLPGSSRPLNVKCLLQTDILITFEKQKFP